MDTLTLITTTLGLGMVLTHAVMVATIAIARRI